MQTTELLALRNALRKMSSDVEAAEDRADRAEMETDEARGQAVQWEAEVGRLKALHSRASEELHSERAAKKALQEQVDRLRQEISAREYRTDAEVSARVAKALR